MSETTKAMRDRIKELATPERDDFDRSVNALLKDFDTVSSCARELEALVYVPGLWKCQKCQFQLVQRSLNASDGTVGTRDRPGGKCPNCHSPLWRVTERAAGNEIAGRCEQEITENSVLRTRITDLETALLAATDHGKRQCARIEGLEAERAAGGDGMRKEARSIEVIIRALVGYGQMTREDVRQSPDMAFDLIKAQSTRIADLEASLKDAEAERDARPVVRWKVDPVYPHIQQLAWGAMCVGTIWPDGDKWQASCSLGHLKDFPTPEAAKAAVEEALRRLSAKTEGA